MDITPIMDERMAKIETTVEYIKDDLRETKQLMKDFIEKADEKYSGKWVEKATMAVLGIVATIIIGYVFRGLK